MGGWVPDCVSEGLGSFSEGEDGVVIGGFEGGGLDDVVGREGEFGCELFLIFYEEDLGHLGLLWL